MPADVFVECDLGEPNSSGYSNHKQRWESIYGPVPDGLEILHKCPNRNCRNIQHLKLGTHSENMKEARDNGTLRPRGYTILTQEQREWIVANKSNLTYLAMAQQLGVHVSRIKHLLSGRTWK